MDPLRCLLAAPGVLSLQEAVSKVDKAFEGMLLVKNPFVLPAEERAARDHLLLVNMVVVFDPKLSFEALMARPGTAAAIAAVRAACDGEPTERRQRQIDTAEAILRSLGTAPVKLACEVQATFTAFAEARSDMHTAYDLARADSCQMLHANFASGAGGSGGGQGGGSTETAFGAAASLSQIWSASAEGQLSVVQAMLKRKADVNAADGDGITALAYATQNNHPDVVGALVAAGADANIGRKSNGCTPMYWAAWMGNVDIVSQLLLAKGVEVDKATQNSGTTPAYTASQQGHTAVLELLIAANADLNKATTDDGATPVWIASEQGHTAVLELLVAANADLDKARTDNGTTPAWIASQHGHAAVLELLIAANADLDKARTDTGSTPAWIASQNGHTAVLELLIAANADLDKATVLGDTPLDIAKQKGHTAIVALLARPQNQEIFRYTCQQRRYATIDV
jgi:ankyrin repeat protein